MKRIAIFASGSGSNAHNIVEHFLKNKAARLEIILTNKREAYVLERAMKYQISTCIFDKKTLHETNNILHLLNDSKIDLIVLAGFLLLVPKNILEAFPGRIINIHPALLPKFGGKGMYGNKVHEAVIANHEKYSGITIHYVNEQYDEGDVIYQKKIELASSETPESLASKIHALEYEYLPSVIEQVLQSMPR
jgi:phosphoribosylglycinamide formyltransferase-1